MLDEPIAAGVNWVKSSWVTNGEGVAGRTLVFDAGGGTLDVALIEVSGSETPEVSVLSANSLAKSGDDIDALIANHFLSMNSQFGLDAVAKKLLLEASRKLKEALSEEESASVQVGHPVSMNLSLTRVEVENIVENQVKESLKIVDRVLVESELRKRADLSVAEIRKTSDQIALSVDNVLLVGGLSQMPIFRQRLQTKFPKAIVHSVSKPQLSVAEGLTYADAIVHLNMPRPPISFVVKPGLEGPADVIYTAFAEIVDPIHAMQGNAYLKYQFDFTNYPEGDYEIFCVLPNRDMTVIPIRFLGASTQENGQCVKVTHSRRSPSESMEFMLYATGEFLVKGKNKCDTYRPLTWRRLSYGADMSEFRLELQIKSSKSWPDDMNDKSMSSKK